MVSFTLTYDQDVLDAITSEIKGSTKAVQIFAEKTLPVIIARELTPIRREPRNPTLPFIWSFDPIKQRRAQRWYFKNKAKNKGGGRYVRTHALVDNWKVNAGVLRDGAIITVSNDTPGLDYVQGPRQVPSHKDSGWAQYDEVLLKAEEKANDIIIDFWLNIVVKR